ncbi:MAG TPA: hypothetical protein VHE08_08720 [Solirubrobacterales bacterium]|nr:hypothetical protein [Solirubrobacterales bacterium]
MDDSRGLIQLEEVVLRACSAEAEWPARIAAGVYAGVDFAIAHPEIADGFASELEGEAERIARYEAIIRRFTGFLQAQAPVGKRLPGSTDAALVGGVVGLVGDYLRLGRADRLEELRPDLVLLVLLPYLGFAEAKSWANRVGLVD